MPRRLALVAVAAALSGCGGGFNDTLLHDPERQIGHTVERTVDVPDRYEILDADYATAYVDTAGNESLSSDIQGRATLTLRVRDRTTGALALLIYEDLRRRSSPTTILQLRAVPGR